jgi:hypothetical protein
MESVYYCHKISSVWQSFSQGQSEAWLHRLKTHILSAAAEISEKANYMILFRYSNMTRLFCPNVWIALELFIYLPIRTTDIVIQLKTFSHARAVNSRTESLPI